MGDIVEFCDKTLAATNAAVEEVKSKVQASATQEEQSMVMESIKEDQKKRKESLRRGKQKKIRFLKYKRNIYGTSEQQHNLNNNSNNHDNGYGGQQQRNYLRNEYSQERSHGQSQYGIRLDDHSERSHWNDRLKDTQ